MPAARLHAARIVCAALVACAAAGAAAPAAAARGHWQRPTSGPLARPFDYAGNPFAAGRHRGVDFAARPGQPVRSACAGRVVFAGTAGSNGPTVSVRCGAWRVAYLPLRTLAVRRGARVGRGAVLGTAGTSGQHAGLHVGVRREGSRWGYVDPLAFLGTPGQLPLAPARRPLRPNPLHRPLAQPNPLRRPPSQPVPLRRPLAQPDPFRRPLAQPNPLRRRLVVPRPNPLRRLPQPNPLRRPLAARRPSPLRPGVGARPDPLRARAEVPRSPVEEAPWPAWAGLTLVLAGACGVGAARRRRVSRPRPTAALARVARE